MCNGIFAIASFQDILLPLSYYENLSTIICNYAELTKKYNFTNTKEQNVLAHRCNKCQSTLAL